MSEQLEAVRVTILHQETWRERRQRRRQRDCLDHWLCLCSCQRYNTQITIRKGLAVNEESITCEDEQRDDEVVMR